MEVEARSAKTKEIDALEKKRNHVSGFTSVRSSLICED